MTTVVSPQAHWLSGPRATPAKIVDYLKSVPTGEYSDADIGYIVAKYWQYGEAGGIDPLLACAQMILETAHLTSYWSQRPRRNPAGIGVTGAPGAGVSFPNWEDSSQAHIGRILAYALPYNVGTDVQKVLIATALGWRDLPANRRGLGQDIETLANLWAEDPLYAGKITSLAGRLIG